MKGVSIKPIIFSCLFYSACTEACNRIGNSKCQSENAISVYPTEEMKANAYEHIKILKNYFAFISDIARLNVFRTSIFITDLGIKKIEVKLKSVDKLKKLQKDMNDLFEQIDRYKGYQKDSNFLKWADLIYGISKSFNDLEKTFNSWCKSLKKEFIRLFQEGTPLHSSFKKEINAPSKNPSYSTISELLASLAWRKYIYQLYYYSKIIAGLSYIHSKFPQEDEINKYESYLKVELNPGIVLIYKFCKAGCISKCDMLLEYSKFSLKKFIKVAYFYMNKFFKNFEEQKSYFKKFANKYKHCAQRKQKPA